MACLVINIVVIATYNNIRLTLFIALTLLSMKLVCLNHSVYDGLLDVSQWCHMSIIKADSRLAPSQWEMSLQSNVISHWLGANLESALIMVSEIISNIGSIACSGYHWKEHQSSALMAIFFYGNPLVNSPQRTRNAERVSVSVSWYNWKTTGGHDMKTKVTQ